MIAGERKLLIVWANPQPPLPAPAAGKELSFAGATVVLTILSPRSVVLTPTMMVDSTDPNPMKHFAYYRTLTTDTPVGGAYWFMPVVTFPDGTILKLTPIFELQVGASL